MHSFSMKAVAAATVIGGAIAGAVTASAALNLPTQSCAYQFNTNMRLGSRGVDVMNLQKVLNAYPQTRVAESGAGSPGMETSYFGPATRAAVNKFHSLHLVELGITAPTGNVYAGTRALLNAICSGNPGTPGTPGTPGNTTGPVSAMLAASQPTGMIVQGQSGARLADIVFTGNGTVTSVQLQRTGVSTDSTLSNVYLYDGNTRITDAASVVTGGYINFNAPSGLFTVSGSRTITVRADIAGSTNGQSVGVKLNSVTANGAVSTFSNVMGNNLQIANVTTASVNLAAMDTTARTVDAGTVGYTVWSGSATVSTRDVNLRAATFKFVGSAPADAFANLSLYVDGSKVAGPAMINVANNNKVTFDLGNSPYLLKTGTRVIEVRGDVVKGSNRTATFSIENVADLMLEDSNLSGVNVSATVASSALTQSNSAYGQITINKGSVTVNVDPTFNATKVTGGATNVPVGQFTLKAYGEDVKVNTLRVTFATTTISSLNNVSLYVNGGQVGTSQNFTSAIGGNPGYLTYTLGSSLIIPANTTVTLTVKADIVDSNNAAYTSGTLATKVGGASSNAQGQSSNELIDVAASQVTGNTLTISSGAATFARTAGFSAVTVAPNTTNVRIGSFTLQAGAAEDVKVNTFNVNPAVSGSPFTITNLSNLKVVSNGVTLGTPVGNPASGSSTFSFADIVIPANGTRTFDVYADFGSATSGSVTAAAGLTYRGAISNTSTTAGAAGVAITAANSSLGTPTLAASSPVGQFVVGGSTFGMATFTLKTASAGTVANVRELRFRVSTGSTDSIESVTVGGVTAPMVAGTSTVTGLNISIGSSGTDVPVTVKYAGYQNTTSGGSLSSTVGNVALSLTYVEATSGAGTVITEGTNVASNTMIHVASKPTVTMSAGNVDTLVLGAENKVAEFTVTADANGKISVGTTSFTLTAIGVTNPQYSSGRVADGNTTISNTSVAGSSTMAITFTTPYEIGAGQSKTFSLYATVAGAAQTGITPYVASTFASSTGFVWYDVIGGNTGETGASIYNFPTSSFTTKR